jgi:hypothetical protein
MIHWCLTQSIFSLSYLSKVLNWLTASSLSYLLVFLLCVAGRGRGFFHIIFHGVGVEPIPTTFNTFRGITYCFFNLTH